MSGGIPIGFFQDRLDAETALKLHIDSGLIVES